MVLQSEYLNACLEAWANAENCIISINRNAWNDKNDALQICDECADFFVSFVGHFEHGSQYMEEIALLCMGLCEECAEICDQYQHIPVFFNCSKSCRNCSDVLSHLLAPSLTF